MAKLSLVKGTTSYRAYIFIQDASVTTGAGKISLAYNTASLKAYYVRPGAAAVAITLITQTVTGAYSSGGFVEIDATNMPGIYRLDVPDAALATGVNAVAIMLSGATNMVPCVLEIELTGVDNQDAAAFGLSRIDAAISSRSTYAGGAVASVTAAVTVGTNNDKTGYGLSAAAVQAIWDALTAALTTAGSVGKLLVDSIDAAISSRLASASYTAPPTAAQNATELLDQAAGVETGATVRQAMRLVLSALAGKLSGAATTTVTIRDTNDSKDRIVATVDSDGNRTAVTLDGS